MAIVTGYSAEKMDEFNNASVIGGAVNTSGSLILKTRGGKDIDAGNVKGAKGDDGPAVGAAQLAEFVPKWKSGTTYKAGQQVISPDNRLVSVKTAHTSSAAFLTDITKWNDWPSVAPYGHMGKTNSFQAISSTAPAVVTFDAAQELRGGVTVVADNNALVVPVTGRYRVHLKVVFSGGGVQNLCLTVLSVNGAAATGSANKLHASLGKQGANDISYHTSGVIPLNAGDKIGMMAQSGSTVWGGNGYDGAFIEIEWVSAL